MTPFEYYLSVSQRADGLAAIGAYVAANTTGVINADEILRAEWVARVSALDLYIHELVAQCLMEVIQGARPGNRLDRIAIQLGTLMASRVNPSANALIDLEIRERLSRETYQDPDSIADAIRSISSVELWNAISLRRGNTGNMIVAKAKELKADLRAIVSRRNKIVHEGDLQPGFPRLPWTVGQGDLPTVRATIDQIVRDIDALVYQNAEFG